MKKLYITVTNGPLPFETMPRDLAYSTLTIDEETTWQRIQSFIDSEILIRRKKQQDECLKNIEFKKLLQKLKPILDEIRERI